MRHSLLLDPGWLFHPGDPTPPLKNTHLAAYMAHKAGYARGPALPNYDDSDWRTVDLPHDWSIEGPFSPDHHISNGYLPRGVAWYRRHFTLDESDCTKHLELLFDGVSGYATVHVNGHLLHRHFSNYTPFTVDITDVATFTPDNPNTIAIKVDATHPEGWWYEGAGIYRHVHLIKSHKLNIPPHGLFVRPVRKNDFWDTAVHMDLRNTGDEELDCDLLNEILDPAGNVVTSSTTSDRAYPRSTRTSHDFLQVHEPQLWSVDSPSLYTLRTTVLIDDAPTETRLTKFGYRTIRFDANEGFFLNDRPLKLKGTCNHQDHAALGVAVPDGVHEQRIRLLKEMGSNAYRSAHNPPAPELLDACDRLGVLVLNENRSFGSSPEHLAQLRALIARDRNHPCVIAWSICNEESIQTTEPALRIARTMAAEAKHLDPSRPVTAAVSGGVLSQNLADDLDLIAINYQPQTYDPYHARHPDKAILAGETGCTYATRDCIETSTESHHFAEDDTAHAPWGQRARDAWRAVRDRPHVAGLFVWTGFDYRGEPTPHGWPSVSSHWGLIDLAGFPKAPYYFHKAYFADPDTDPFVYLTPHWTHPGRDGQSIAVHAYTNADEAELFLNDKSHGRQKVDPIDMATWTVPYTPGALRAVAYRNNEIVATTTHQTAATPAAVDLSASQISNLKSQIANPAHPIPLILRALDANNLLNPTAANEITLTVTGPATLLSLANGDPTNPTPKFATTIRLFNGHAAAHIQPQPTPGTITITATSPGLAPATLTLTTHPADLPPTVPPVVRPRHLTDWRISPPTPTRPDPTQSVSDQDMNTWERVQLTASSPPRLPAPGYVIYRATFTPLKRLQQTGGRIRIPSLDPAAEVFLDRSHAAANPSPRDFPFPATSSALVLSILLPPNSPPLAGPIELLPPV